MRTFKKRTLKIFSFIEVLMFLNVIICTLLIFSNNYQPYEEQQNVIEPKTISIETKQNSIDPLDNQEMNDLNVDEQTINNNSKWNHSYSKRREITISVNNTGIIDNILIKARSSP